MSLEWMPTIASLTRYARNLRCFMHVRRLNCLRTITV